MTLITAAADRIILTKELTHYGIKTAEHGEWLRLVHSGFLIMNSECGYCENSEVEYHISCINSPPEVMQELSDPCLTCNGDGYCVDSLMSPPDQIGQPCPDCDGQQKTFTLHQKCPNVDSWGYECEGNYEIAQNEWRPCLLCDGESGKPGIIDLGDDWIVTNLLPIYGTGDVYEEWSHNGWTECIAIAPNGAGFLVTGDKVHTPITLPAAACLGMWVACIEKKSI